VTALIVTSSTWPTGEPGAEELDRSLAARGMDARWVCWDDSAVDWAAADLVAVRSPAVVKPRIGAGGAGVLVVDDPADPRLGQEFRDHPELPTARGPWIVQPLVESVRTEGRPSVFVLDGRAISELEVTEPGL